MTSKFTCINCRVAFSDTEIQRQHYKSDWHRYNLKRKVAQLPPVSAEEFHRRVLLQREQDVSAEKDNSVYCNVCHKSFSSQQSFENHLKSKKHQSLAENLPKLGGNLKNGSLPEESNHTKTISTVNRTISKSSDSENESDVEEVDSDEWDQKFSDNNPILENNCLFCCHHGATMTKVLKHMSIEHSFFVPDIEYVVDLKGLLCYLGEKIVQGYMCIWCNQRGKTFYSSEAVQQHMVDKGHCKMLHEGDTLLEYSDYYDYSSSYPDDYCKQESKDDEMSIPVIEDRDYKLVLPSGAVAGHRSLVLYYRQHFNPHQAIVPSKKKTHNVIEDYRALGWKGTDKQAASKKARDLRFMQCVYSKYYMKLGVKANILNIKRPQVNF